MDLLPPTADWGSETGSWPWTGPVWSELTTRGKEEGPVVLLEINDTTVWYRHECDRVSSSPTMLTIPTAVSLLGQLITWIDWCQEARQWRSFTRTLCLCWASRKRTLLFLSLDAARWTWSVWVGVVYASWSPSPTPRSQRRSVPPPADRLHCPTKTSTHNTREWDSEGCRCVLPPPPPNRAHKQT